MKRKKSEKDERANPANKRKPKRNARVASHRSGSPRRGGFVSGRPDAVSGGRNPLGLRVKGPALGQHFLRRQDVVDHMIDRVDLDSGTTVMEIGCGDGFLTRAILDAGCGRLLCFEIDPEWRDFVAGSIKDPRLEIELGDVMKRDWSKLPGPLTMLANLPYQISFPVMFAIMQNKWLFAEGVVMLQEEVAQKLVARSGRSYTHVSVLLQHHFEFELMDKVGPESFDPPPKVMSRLVYFKPVDRGEVPDGERFWRFIKQVFASPRRTLKNNLKSAGYSLDGVSTEVLELRAQQIDFDGFLKIWEKIR